MPQAKLLSREPLSKDSLTSQVEKAQHRKPPYAEYTLRITATQLDITQTSKPNQYIKPISHDEGFESDIDTLSLVSSDDSFTSSTCLVEDHVLKHRENDSANGSASSDSDTETIVPEKYSSETHQLIDVLCYTDVKCPKVLVFVIKDEVLVFYFDNVEHLQSFYTSFNTLKAVTNQKTYARNLGTKFNLLQRTDQNGVTHIEISREPSTKIFLPPSTTETPTNIISINTPDALKPTSRVMKPVLTTFERKPVTQNFYETKPDFERKPTTQNFYETKPDFERKPTTQNFYDTKPELKSKIISMDDSKVVLQSEMRASRSEFYPNTTISSFTLRPKIMQESTKPKQLETNTDLEILKTNNNKDDGSLKKVWKSAEDLLEAPKRPERRRKLKGKAPPPPVDAITKQNVMKGQFVRVAVDPKKQIEKVSRSDDPVPNFQTFSSNIQTFTPNWNNLKQPQSPLILATTAKHQFGAKNYQNIKIPEFRKCDASHLSSKGIPSWTNSVPRLLRKPRSRSETRNATPMAYRYIDTTKSQNQNYNNNSNTNTISNRLFGLSQKLKEFGNNVVSSSNKNYNYYDATDEARRNSIGEMTYKVGSTESSLKSVIKKQDDKRNKIGSEQKKVTFSAYAIVQVV